MRSSAEGEACALKGALNASTRPEAQLAQIERRERRQSSLSSPRKVRIGIASGLLSTALRATDRREVIADVTARRAHEIADRLWTPHETRLRMPSDYAAIHLGAK
jgi:hypothetical protein